MLTLLSRCAYCGRLILETSLAMHWLASILLLALCSDVVHSKPLIPLSEPEGLNLLKRSNNLADYGYLIRAYITQANLAYCAVASSVMVMNSLAIPAPEVNGFRGYRFWTQENIFNHQSSADPFEPGRVRRQGMTLQELAQFLQSHGVKVSRRHADTFNVASLRNLMNESLGDPNVRLIVNYFRPGLKQKGGGHFSPVAAYDKESDRVLILDVARYRYPSVWVQLTDLLSAMQTPDYASGSQRGLLLIKR